MIKWFLRCISKQIKVYLSRNALKRDVNKVFLKKIVTKNIFKHLIEGMTFKYVHLRIIIWQFSYFRKPKENCFLHMITYALMYTWTLNIFEMRCYLHFWHVNIHYKHVLLFLVETILRINKSKTISVNQSIVTLVPFN